MTQLSTEVFTHKLKIKGDGTRYITKKFAEGIFNQLNDSTIKTLTIKNSSNLTYFQKYKSEVELHELKGEEKGFEAILHNSGLLEHQKDYIRGIWNQRKKENKSTSDTVLQEILETYKEK